MKKIILLAMMTLCASTSNAERLEFCTWVSDKVMYYSEVRYRGASLSKTINLVGENSAYTPIIYDAYKLPDYDSQDMQLQAATELANRYFRICMESK